MEHVDQLAALFPDIERDLLDALLQHHGSIERVVDELLEVTPTDPAGAATDEAHYTTDEAMARTVQEGLDAEVAAALQQELDRERQAQAPRASPAQADPVGVAAAAAAERVKAGTKRGLLVLQRSVKALAERNRGAHGQRLLDESTSSDLHEPLQISPLAPLYSPPMPTAPQISVPTPPPVAPTPPPNTSSTRADGDAPPSPPATKYVSRVERARMANRLASRSAGQYTPLGRDAHGEPLTSSLAPPSPAIGAQAGPAVVPVGELI